MRDYTDKEFHELPEWAKNEIFKLEGQVSRLAALLRQATDSEYTDKQLAMLGLPK